MSLNTINSQPYGILVEGNPSSLYEKLTKETVLVAREGFAGSQNVKHIGISSDVNKTFSETTHFALCGDLLAYHKARSMETGEKLALNEFTPVKIIVIEIESILTSEAEYSLILYIYLLRTGSILPRLYVLLLCDVPSIRETVGKLLQCEQMSCQSSPTVSLRDCYVSPQDYFDATKGSLKHTVLDTSGITRQADSVFSLLADDFLPGKKGTIVRRLSELVSLVIQGDIDLVCLDSTVRISVSALYAGNRRVKKSISETFLARAIELLKSLKTGIRVVILRNPEARELDEVAGIFRENVFKDFSQDVVLFLRHNISLRDLYANYSPNDDHLRSRITQAESLVYRLGNTEQISLQSFAFLVNSLRVHPTIAKIVFLWKTSGKPLFAILLFVATIYGFDKTTREVKEHGLKEVDNDFALNCRLGEAMKRSLDIITRWQTVDTPELGETGTVLKRLLVKMAEYNNDGQHIRLGVFDLNRFCSLMGTLIREHFSSDILTKIPDGAKTGTIMFRNTKHPQISWRVSNNPPFTEIFPLISMLERNSHRVLLFMPL